MTAKNLDKHHRWRNKTVSFRVSEEESNQIDIMVKLSGLSKQDYITKRLMCKEIVVHGNSKVFRNLQYQLTETLHQLQRIESGKNINDELLDIIQIMIKIIDRLTEDTVDGSR